MVHGIPSTFQDQLLWKVFSCTRFLSLRKTTVKQEIIKRVGTRSHKESFPAHLPPPHPPEPIFFSGFVCFFGGSFLGRVPMNGLLHTPALSKRLGKQANTARATDVKLLYFRLFRYVNPFVNARVVNVVRNNRWWASAALGHETL